jgi:hypothetical protein
MGRIRVRLFMGAILADEIWTSLAEMGYECAWVENALMGHLTFVNFDLYYLFCFGKNCY